MNNVNIIGMLREKVDDTSRYFEYELPYENEKGDTSARIVVKNWTNQSKTRVSVMPEGARVAISGHLDGSEKFGTILIVEQLQSVSK